MTLFRKFVGLIHVLLARAALGAEAIELDANFDQGSLAVNRSTVIGEDVALAGRDNFYPGRWKWVYFAVEGVADRRPRFHIRDNFALGGDDLKGHEMVYSYDQRTWHHFDHNAWRPEQGRFEFSNNRPFTAPKVHVAFGVPYPYQRAVRHMKRVAASPWARPTAAGKGSLVLGQTLALRDDLGRRIPPRNLYAYEIGDFDSAERDFKVVLVSGVHANESPGNFVLEGLVDFLIGDEVEAEGLRRRAAFFIYPMVNPDGRYAGYNRGVVQPDVHGPNRHWTPPHYGGLYNLHVIGEAMKADAAPADIVIDFHADAGGKSGHYAFVLPEWQQHSLWEQYRQREPTVRARDAQLVNHTMARFGRDELGAEFSITFETQFLPGEDANRYRELGANWGRSLHDALVSAPRRTSSESPSE